MSARRGFTLIETLVALCLLGVAASVMVAPIYRYSRDVNGIGNVQARNGLTARETARLLTMPWDSLDSRVGCAAIAGQPLPHNRCVTITIVNEQQKSIQLVMDPLAAGLRSDTVVLGRTRPTADNPFSL